MRKISYRFVYNRKKSLNDRGTALVQVEAYLNKKKVYFSTHVYLRPEQWDVKRKIIKDHPNQDALNGMLNEFIIELEKKELSLWRQGKTITLSLIKEEFKSNTDASFLGFARKEIMSSQLKDSTKRNHLTTISLLQSFKPTIEFEDLTYNFVTDFEKFLYESGYQGEFYQFNLSSCIRQQNSLTAQFVSFSLANLANIFYPPPIFTIINLCLL